VKHNCALLKERLGQGRVLCAVVKADGYGHGASWCARAAVAGGAGWLAVATAEEAVELRRHGFTERVLVMGALNNEELDVALEEEADIVVWRKAFIDVVAAKAERVGRQARIHVKLDTGMGRLGTPDVEEALELIEAGDRHPGLAFTGLMTHFATADEPDSPFFDEQLDRFRPLAERVKRNFPRSLVHAANSAALLRSSEAHFDMARCGIAIYGLDPFHDDPVPRGLRPALALESYVADVKPLRAGDSVGYGRTWTASRETSVAVVPIGYGDGYRRGLSNNGEVIVNGRRYPVVGTVSMDNITIDVGPDARVQVGDLVTLIGEDGDESVRAEELARMLGTINYEIACGLAPRVRRLYHRAPEDRAPDAEDP
jgi:alanine racemase